jgi:hypothetical protein
MTAGLPVLVGINRLNRRDFDAFSAGLAEMLPSDDRAVLDWCARDHHAAASPRGMTAPAILWN